MRIIKIALIFIAVMLTGCASNPMKLTQDKPLLTPSQEQVQVVFMRDSFLGHAINGSLYDVTNGEPEFLGIIANDTKVTQMTQPGKHVYMVVSEAADFLEAELEGGKTYFSVVTPRMGAWKARFSLWPYKQDTSAEYVLDGSEFKSVLKGTKYAELTAKANAWYSANKDSVKAKQAKYWPVWEKKSPEDILKRTLQPQDGK
ncbi:hypothetical protein Q4561_07740 [Alteromonas sp. 1_MG-2023]|uniref:hypothetical protein n=1 Tax=Alteromonas sp. 1_MG-2023 TaxID=3062669 RepID=UPI0026E17F7C|nr:hypothetical protein [Alteromonas sp. 1_MG-2023]MDO6566948.1 hypothetical protein [Alteromonas sp. 1_MG-2023]